MKKVIVLILVFVMSLTVLFGCNKESTPGEEAKKPMVDPIDDNYRTFYQVFVGSFSDSNGDGIGDLRGVINRFDYLNDGDINSGKSLGVQGIWLSPIFSSPSYHKYDTTDYYRIDWRFGTEDDLKELSNLCKERNVKLILDLVLNHTSTSHPWFKEFQKARMNGDTTNKYYDYYTCVTTAEKKGGVKYQKVAGVDCWYECNFSGDMPELNYDNPDVKQAMLDVAKYYLDLGIDGFRFDAIKYIYYGDTAKSVEFWKWYMEEIYKINPDVYCVGECWSGETEILDYYAAVNCFNFGMSQAEGAVARAVKGSSISNFTVYVESLQKNIYKKNPNGMLMPFLSNHDVDRIAGAFITENYMRMAANMYLLCAGSPVIYYGEEIGMRGSRGGENTDANRRLAMLWGDDDEIENPIGSTYSDDKQIQTTVAEQINDENSLYNYYCKLISIRHKYPAIARGGYSSFSYDSSLGGFIIKYENETFLLLHNTDTEDATLDLAANSKLTDYKSYSIGDYIGVGSAKIEGATVTLGGQTSVIINCK